jgi:hypothetical protein
MTKPDDGVKVNEIGNRMRVSGIGCKRRRSEVIARSETDDIPRLCLSARKTTAIHCCPATHALTHTALAYPYGSSFH